MRRTTSMGHAYGWRSPWASPSNGLGEESIVLRWNTKWGSQGLTAGSRATTWGPRRTLMQRWVPALIAPLVGASWGFSGQYGACLVSLGQVRPLHNLYMHVPSCRPLTPACPTFGRARAPALRPGRPARRFRATRPCTLRFSGHLAVSCLVPSRARRATCRGGVGVAQWPKQLHTGPVSRSKEWLPRVHDKIAKNGCGRCSPSATFSMMPALCSTYVQPAL